MHTHIHVHMRVHTHTHTYTHGGEGKKEVTDLHSKREYQDRAGESTF